MKGFGKLQKTGFFALVFFLFVLVAIPGTVLANWPDGSQGGQYAAVNESLDTVAADIGVTSSTFIDTYNSAISGPVTLSSQNQLDYCEVLARLIAYQPTLTEYSIVYANMGCRGLVPVDTQAPVITSVGPSGTIYTSSTTITADYYDPAYSSGIGGVDVTLNGSEVLGCSSNATHVSCPVSGLTNGDYVVQVTVSDKNEPPLSVTSGSVFHVNLCPYGAPALAVTSGSPYWASYFDYMLGNLSVHYTIYNGGPADAKAVTIVGMTCTNGVILQSWGSNVGDISSGGTAGFLATFSVPYFVTHFYTQIYATAKDTCNNSFSYPGPYGGGA